MILLVIISNNILLSPLIALIYHLIFDNSPFQYIKPHSFIVGNLLPYIALLRNAQTAILFIMKHTICHLIVVLTSTYLNSICWDAIFFDSILLAFESLFIALQLQANNAVINPFPAKLVAYGVTKKCFQYTKSLRPMELLYRW